VSEAVGFGKVDGYHGDPLVLFSQQLTAVIDGPSRVGLDCRRFGWLDAAGEDVVVELTAPGARFDAKLIAQPILQPAVGEQGQMTVTRSGLHSDQAQMSLFVEGIELDDPLESPACARGITPPLQLRRPIEHNADQLRPKQFARLLGPRLETILDQQIALIQLHRGNGVTGRDRGLECFEVDPKMIHLQGEHLVAGSN